MQYNFSESALREIGELFDRSTVLALGEGIHTSDGFYEAKLEVFRYLIEHHDLRVVFFETPWSQAEVVERYLSGGATLTEAIDSLLYVWRSTSIARFLIWLKTLRENGLMVRFMGFDIQSPAVDLDIISPPRIESLSHPNIQAYWRPRGHAGIIQSKEYHHYCPVKVFTG
jgi:erythromycin esterase-like protein